MKVGQPFDVSFCCVQIVEVARAYMLRDLPPSLHSMANATLQDADILTALPAAAERQDADMQHT